MGQGPVLLGDVFVAPVDAVEVHGLFSEQVAEDEDNHVRIPAGAASQVDDQGAGACEGVHGLDGRVPAPGRAGEVGYLQMAHVAGQPLCPAEAMIVQFGLDPLLGQPILVLAQLALVVGQGLGVPTDPQVFVATGLLQVVGQRVGQEFALGDALIVPVIQMLLKASADLFGDAWEDVVGPESL